MQGRRLLNTARKPSQLLSRMGCCGEVAGAEAAVLVPPRGLGSAVPDAHGIPLAEAAVPPGGLERGRQLCPCALHRRGCLTARCGCLSGGFVAEQ